MEAVLLQSDSHHQHHHRSISLNRNRYIQNPNNNFISRSYSENFSPSYPNIHGGVGGGSSFYSAPSMYSSAPSFYSSSVPIINQKQPPLLPLPTKKPYASLPLIPIRPNNNNNNNRPLIPSSPIRKNNNRSSSARDQPDHSSKKKSKSSSVISPKKQIQSITSSTVKGGDVNLMISSKRLGPEPCDIPEQVSRAMKQQPTAAVKVVDVDEEFSGSIFALAPPPSSLPLPKFSMRPRLSCNVEAIGCAGIDNGVATDSLCRMLRLR